MNEFLQHCLNALVLGGTYALLGIGLTLIFGIMRVVNFTHGELYAFGAYMMYGLVMKLGVNFFVALVLATGLGVVLGGAIELALLRRLRSTDIDITMLVMIGAWITLQNTEQLAWTGVAQSIAHPFPADPLVIGGLSVSWNRIFVFAIAVLLIAATYFLVNGTKLGMAMRATFQDRGRSNASTPQLLRSAPDLQPRRARCSGRSSSSRRPWETSQRPRRLRS